VYARARVGSVVSEADSASFTIRPSDWVEWQIVRRNNSTDPAAWGVADGLASWSFTFATSDYGRGNFTIVARLIQDGAEVARTSVRAQFR
jgi:hypothetical protein